MAIKINQKAKRDSFDLLNCFPESQVPTGKFKIKIDRWKKRLQAAKKAAKDRLQAALKIWGDQPVGVQFDEVRKEFTELEANATFFGADSTDRYFPWFLSRYNASVVLISNFCSERTKIFGIISEFCGERYTETRTLELAVSYVDRLLEEDMFDMAAMQSYDVGLTAIAACWQASKTEEYYASLVDEGCLSLTEHFIKAYCGSWDKVCRRAKEIKYELHYITEYTTASNYLSFNGKDEIGIISQHPNIIQSQIVRFLIEVGLYVRYEMGSENWCSSRVLAAAAVILATIITENMDQSRKTVVSLLEHILVTEVRPSVQRIYEFLVGEINACNPIFVKFWLLVGDKKSLPEWSVIRDLIDDVTRSTLVKIVI